MVRNGGSAVCGGFKQNKKQLLDYLEHLSFTYVNIQTSFHVFG